MDLKQFLLTLCIGVGGWGSSQAVSLIIGNSQQKITNAQIDKRVANLEGDVKQIYILDSKIESLKGEVQGIHGKVDLVIQYTKR